MGIFDLFGKKKDTDGGSAEAGGRRNKGPREMARLAKLVGNKMTQNYDRQEALEQLATLGTSESAGILLTRFSWSMEPSITDQEEKEIAVRGIVAAGDAGLDPIRRYCQKADSLTWPLKALEKLTDEGAFTDELLTILDQFDTEYVRNPEPKIQLLMMLETRKSNDVRVAVEAFLEDASEPVRFHAVTTVLAMDDPASLVPLIEAMAAEESLRVKNRIATGLVDRGWSLPAEVLDSVREALPAGFRVEGEKVAGAAARG